MRLIGTYLWLPLALLLALSLAACGDDDTKGDPVCETECDANACETCGTEGACISTCATGEVCNAGTCEAATNDCDPACDASACQVCNSGACESSCTADQTCNAGMCEAITVTCDPACATGETCVNGTCEPDVVTCDPACATGETCVNGTCEPDAVTCDPACATGETCVNGTCEASGPSAVGGACVADSDCLSGICYTEFDGLPSGYCIDDCVEGPTNGCDDTGALCVSAGSSNFCAATCTPGGSDCRDGYECIDLGDGSGVCWANCTDNAQCSAIGYCDLDSGFCDCAPGEHFDDVAGACVYDTCVELDCGSAGQICTTAGGCSGACDICEDCPAGQHYDADTDACAADTCESLDCAGRNMICDESGAAPVCNGCLDSTYVEGPKHCYPAGAAWGGPCMNDGDCPGTGTPGSDTFCDPYTGGFCVQVEGPDITTEGQPCGTDTNSVAVEESWLFGSYMICYAGCTTDTDCRAGYTCTSGLGSAGTISACLPISDCDTAGCNDPGTTLRCDAADTMCWLDACTADPCNGISGSTGTCMNTGDNFACECDGTHAWNTATATCDVFTCTSTALTTAGVTGGTSCSGTNLYEADNSPSGSCTGYGTPGQDIVYAYELAASTMATFTLTNDGSFDSALFVITACNDVVGATCVAGDDSYGGDEELYIINDTASPVTYYVIVDAYDADGCGGFDLAVVEGVAPVCGDGTIAAGIEACDDGNAIDADGCTACAIDTNFTCDDTTGTSVCSAVVCGDGVFATGYEDCDDGNTDPNDGCDATCGLELGYSCDSTTGSSVCTPFDDLGTVAATDAIAGVSAGGALAADASHYYTITFTTDVLLSGALTTPDGDADLYIYDSTGTSVAAFEEIGNETITNEALTAGKYFIEVYAYDAVTDYVLTLSTTAP